MRPAAKALTNSIRLGLAIIALCASAGASRAAPESKRILLLFTNESHQAGAAIVEDALRSNLQTGSPTPLELYFEYLDAVRLPLANRESELVEYLKRKYADKKIDLVLCVNPPALNFIRQNRSSLFPEAPVVYLVLDQQSIAGLDLGRGFTGVWGEINYREGLDMALSLHPGTKRVVIITGVSQWDNYWRTEVQREFRSLEGAIDFSYLTGLTISQQKAALSSLPSQTLVIFVSSTQDRNGDNASNLEVLKQIAPASRAPIYGGSDAQLGLGIVGGKVLSLKALGEEGARVGLRLLAGQTPEQLPAHGVPTVAMFDWRELRRWGIPEDRVPPGSVVLFKEPTLWEQYKWGLLALLAAIVIEAGLIARLLFTQDKRRQAEQEAAKTHRRLQDIVSNVPGMVWETVIDKKTRERHTTFVSDYVRKMLGYTPEEWLAQPPGFGLRIMAPEDRDRALAETEAAIATGTEEISEHRWRAKDGRLVWIESHLSPVVNGTGEAEGLRGVSLDITERKLAEENLQKTQEKERAILEAMPDLMFLQTAEGVYLDYHANNKENLYVPPNQYLGKNMSEILPPDLAKKFAHYFKRAMETGETQIVEYTLAMPNGERWFEARLVRTEGNILSVVRDTTERKLADEALRESEINYRSIFNAANDAIFVHEPLSGKIVDVNQSMCEMYGYTIDEVKNMTVGDLSSNISPYTQDEAIALIQKAQRGEPVVFEWHAKHKSGRLFWVEVALKRVTLRGRDYLLAVVRDITERKHALDELRESEERFGKAFRSNPQPMSITILKNGVYIDVNDSFLAMSGYSRAEVIGHSSLALGVWISAERRAQFIKQLQAKGSLRNRETTFRTKNGTDRVLLSSAELVEIGGEDCVLITSSDITERILAEQALAESEQRFRLMADTAPVMIWVSGPDKLCTYFNKRWLDFTGRTIDQEVGNGWTEGVHPDDFDRCLHTYVTAFDSREQFRMEYRLRRFDGEYRWLIDHGAPRFSSTKQFLGYIGSCLDFTDRKESEEAAAAAHEELLVAHDEVQRLKAQLEEENIYLQEEIRQAKNFGEMIGESDAIKYVMFKVNHVAVTDSTVLITGETGTGKELVARAIHTASARSDRSLITVNCAALPATLIESELFGHEKGAFTGAVSRKPGRFELADRGTIFLDEVGELPLESQVKLLRVIQEGEVQRLGGTNPIKVDVRIIAATNRNLRREIDRGAFREDLWYRLNVFPITVPPLRQRTEDIPLLVQHFVSNYANKFGKTITSISPQAMQKLQEHSWPGNVRELANVIERAVIYTQGTALNVFDVLEQQQTGDTAADPSVMKSLEEVEREYILHILEHTQWRIEGPRGAAKLLGMNPSTLRTRMIKLGISKPALGAAH